MDDLLEAEKTGIRDDQCKSIEEAVGLGRLFQMYNGGFVNKDTPVRSCVAAAVSICTCF